MRLKNTKRLFPPILAEFSRTMGSTYNLSSQYQSPSSKIGQFYTPTASLYRINVLRKKIEYSNYLPFFQADIKLFNSKVIQKLTDYQLKHPLGHCTDMNGNPSSEYDEYQTSNSISSTDVEISKSCQRYYHYITSDTLISESILPSLEEATIARILNKLEPDLSVLHQSEIENTLELNLENIQNDYKLAMRQAIVDYVLKNTFERQRLDIKIPPLLAENKQWGRAILPVTAPLAWRSALQYAWQVINENSYFVNPCMIDILSIWQKYCQFSLFAKPVHSTQVDKYKQTLTKNLQQYLDEAIDAGFANHDHNNMGNVTSKHGQPSSSLKDNLLPKVATLPMHITDYQEFHNSHLEYIKEVFCNQWWNECANVLKSFVEENNLESSEPETMLLFQCVQALMSQQLCQIVTKSLNDCVNFFQSYCNASFANLEKAKKTNQIVDIQQNSFNANNVEPLWLISLQLSGSHGRDGASLQPGINYEIPLDSLSQFVDEIIDDIVSAMSNISCVEAKVFALLENVPNLNVFIDDHFVNSCKDKIYKSMKKSIDSLNTIKNLYKNEYDDLFLKDRANLKTWLNMHATDVFKISDDSTTQFMIHDITNLEDSAQTLNVYQTKLSHYQSIIDNLKHSKNPMLNCGLFTLECYNINDMIIQQSQEIKETILSNINSNVFDTSLWLLTQYDHCSTMLLSTPQTSVKLVELTNYIEIFQSKYSITLHNICCNLNKQMFFLFKHKYLLTNDTLRNITKVGKWNQKIKSHLEIANKQCSHQRDILETQYHDKQQTFKDYLKSIVENELQHFQYKVQLNDINNQNKISDNIEMLHELSKKLEVAKEQQNELKLQRQLLNLESSQDLSENYDDVDNQEYRILQQIENSIKPFQDLWNLIQKFTKKIHEWYKSTVFSMKYDQIQSDLNLIKQSTTQLQKHFQQIIANENTSPPVSAGIMTGANKSMRSQLAEDESMSQLQPDTESNRLKNKGSVMILDSIQDQISSFEQKMELLKILCNPSMKESHWKQVSSIVGFEISPETPMNLEYFINRRLEKYLTQLTTISDQASDLVDIKTTMSKMKYQWQSVHINTKLYINTIIDSNNTESSSSQSKIYLLTDESYNSLSKLSSEHSQNMSRIRESQAYKNETSLKNEIDEWNETFLIKMKQIIQLWYSSQTEWQLCQQSLSTALAASSTANDINSLLVEKSTDETQLVTAYQTADSMLRRTMQVIHQTRLAVNICEIPNIISDLNTICENLKILTQTFDA